MPAPITVTKNWMDDRIDEVIDVRSPAEFVEDHIPGAINLPVFSNEERAEIGTIYKQESAFLARRKGATLVSQNIAKHIQDKLADRPENWRPLIHCWRGGQRSRAFAHICAEIGWACFLLEGGYKSYRGEVLDGLRTMPETFKPILISGKTGSGKTHLLHAIARAGGQIIDLEGIAIHRGSLLGGVPGQPQPSQRLFESQLHHALRQIDIAQPVFIEAESSRIGDVSLPKELWHVMGAAPMIEVATALPTRLALLKLDYPHLLHEKAAALHQLIEGMAHRHGADITAAWRDNLHAQNFDEFIASVLAEHYDPAYERKAKQHDRACLGNAIIDDESQEGFDNAARDCLKIAHKHMNF